jgi:hypothetical protein
MALQIFGDGEVYNSISLSQINVELGRSATSSISLDGAENGSYGAINTNSPSRPSGSNPASMYEWYEYDHSYAPADTQSPTAPGTPYLSGNPSSSYGSIVWSSASDNVGVTGYQTYRDNSLYGSTTSLSTSISFNPTGGQNTWKVRAYDAAGNYSGFSGSRTVYANPNAVSISASGSTETSITITYPQHVANGGINRGEVYINGSWHMTPALTSSTTSITIGQLSSGTSYNIKLRLYNTSYTVKGAWSNEINSYTDIGGMTTM